ncbi:DUF4399 domain-containing protein [Roseateles sp.]|uniref:DUF4399 domain-containing protein n=1 Tax=Roseateles sp. TaxID=1971397 RepID=UPI003D0C3B02
MTKTMTTNSQKPRITASLLASYGIGCLLLMGGALAPAAAQTPGPSPHPWLASAPRLAQQTHFTNLQDGAKIETPFLLTFGLTGMGIAPITKAQSKTGHHHLLINRDLPLDFNQPLPFNEQYVHFGKGQMETVLTLKPGDYTLRLVLADHRHVPNFVYSKPLKITVTKFNGNVKPETLSQPGISLRVAGSGDKSNEAREGSPVQVLFHASKLNVSHQALQEPGTGHFRLSIAPEGGGKTEVLSFPGGETEAWLKPPKGKYQLKLDFVDNVQAGKVLFSAGAQGLQVVGR